jgi:hypothetical protein
MVKGDPSVFVLQTWCFKDGRAMSISAPPAMGKFILRRLKDVGTSAENQCM